MNLEEALAFFFDWPGRLLLGLFIFLGVHAGCYLALTLCGKWKEDTKKDG